MFSFILKRRRPIVNIFKRDVVKCQTNCNTLSRLFDPCMNEVINDVGMKQFGMKQMRINYTNIRKYSCLPEPIEAKIPRKIFVGHEDSFAHSILENKEIYSQNIAKDPPAFDDEISKNEIDNYINQSWKSLPIPEIIKAFQRISYYAHKNGECISDERYEKFIKYLITNCKQFTDSEIHDVLLSISLWPTLYSREDKIFSEFYQALDKECFRRAPDWTVDELLLTSDHWYKTRLYKYTEFANYVVRKLGSRSNRMNSNNLVQYMFYVNVSRSHPREMYNLEYKMEACIDDLDLNELAVIGMGFFKSQTPIRNSNLLVKIIHRVIREIDTVHEISLSVFMKIIRYSSVIQNDCAILWELLVSTIPQLPRLSLQALIHIVGITVKIRIFHPDLLTGVAERFNKEIEKARVKDMERLVLALSCFKFTPNIEPNIYETVIKELRTPGRTADLERYQKSLANLLQYLSVVNIYPKDLISIVLDQENLALTYGPTPFRYSHSILVIDLNIDAEVPDYTGPRLSSRSRSIIAKGYVNKMPESNNRTLSIRHTFLRDILDTCDIIFKSPEMVHVDWILPQFKEADVILCLDKNNCLLPVKKYLSEIPLGEVKKRPEIIGEGSRWIALVIGAPNCYIRNSTELLGKDFVKIRQLKRIGYQPIVLPWHEWPMNERDRKNYLKEKIFK